MKSVGLTADDLKQFGQMLVDEIVNEAKKDFAKQRKGGGGPQGLPDSQSFFDSFSYQIKGDAVEVTSDWPWIEDLITGKKPFKMTWLTRRKGVHKVPIVQRDGKIVIRSAPLSTADAWIHPGIAKHTFIERGVKKARDRFAPVVFARLKEMMLGG